MFISPFDIVMKSSQSAHRRIVHIKVSLFVSAYQHIHLCTFNGNMNNSLKYSDTFYGQLWQATLQEICMKKVSQ